MNEVFSSLKCRSRIPTFGSLFGPNHTDGAFWLGLHYGGSDGKFKKAILSYLLKILLFKENEQKSCFSKVKKFWKKIRKIVKKKLKNVEKKCWKIQKKTEKNWNWKLINYTCIYDILPILDQSWKKKKEDRKVL